MTDYELYFGPYTLTRTPPHGLWRTIYEAVKSHDLFPNGQYEVKTTDGEHIVRFEANLLFSRHRNSRPVKAVVGDIKTLLGHCETVRSGQGSQPPTTSLLADSIK